MKSVAVICVATREKKYCRFLWPKTFNSLTYKNKSAVLIDEEDWPEMLKKPDSEQRTATGRQIGMAYAKAKGFDWVLFLDPAVEPDVDCIEKLLAVNHSVVAGLQAQKGNAWLIDGHNIKNQKLATWRWLKNEDVCHNQEVDSLAGSLLLLARGILDRVNYRDYQGQLTLPGRTINADEYLYYKILQSFKIKPRACFDCRSWYYHTNGRAYKLFGEQKIWKVF